MNKCKWSIFKFGYYFQYTEDNKFQILGKNEEGQWTDKLIYRNSIDPQPLTLHNIIAVSLCFLFGHKISKYTDSGAHICERCRAHEGYDTENNSGKWDNAGYLLQPYYWLIRKYEDIVFKIKDKNKLPF